MKYRSFPLSYDSYLFSALAFSIGKRKVGGDDTTWRAKSKIYLSDRSVLKKKLG